MTQTTLTFTTRETYMTFRADWKAEYKQVSTDIRLTKNLIKETQRASGSTSMQIYHRLNMLRARATGMLIALIEAKKMAQQQYTEEHKEVAHA